MIRITHLTKSYGNKTLFKDLNYHIPEGEKIALVGDNGCGKTTLLRILTGLEEADQGQLILPKTLKIGHLDQHLDSTQNSTVLDEALTGNQSLCSLKTKLTDITEQLKLDSSDKIIHQFESIETNYRASGGYSYEAEAKRILMGLGFDHEQQTKKARELSGGWKIRLAIAKMFLNQPNFIILDEPTNHLDLPSLVWFENYLNSFAGTIVLVSHDKELLQRFPTRILHLENGDLRAYKGTYDDFLKKSESHRAHQEKTKDQLYKKQQHLQSFVDRFGAKATKAAQAQSKMKLIQKLSKQIETLDHHHSKKQIGIFNFDIKKVEKVVCTIKEASLGYQKPLLKKITLEIQKDQKLAIVGSNGIGKSTMIKSLAKIIPPLSGNISWSASAKIAYFSQNLLDHLSSDETLINCLKNQTPLSENEARKLLGSFLFQKDDPLKKLSALSGGEMSRFGLVYALAQKPNILLLDEPTNHLDMKSTEILTQFLKSFPGTIIFVSHNRFFINEIATHTIAFSKDGHFFSCEGNLHDYIRLSKHSAFPNIFTENDPDKKPQIVKQKDEHFSERKKEQRKHESLKRKIKQLEKTIKKLTLDIQQIELELSIPDIASDFKKSHELNSKLQEKKTNKESMEEQWLQVHDEIESNTKL